MEVDSEVQEKMHFEESFVDDDRKRVTPDTDWSHIQYTMYIKCSVLIMIGCYGNLLKF